MARNSPSKISLRPIQTAGGLLVASAIRDLSSRKKAEANFRELLEGVPNAMVIVDSAAVIMLVHTQTEKLLSH